jgi:predicted hotdog family 3-hydroxylacyl-ACP dehydratase
VEREEGIGALSALKNLPASMFLRHREPMLLLDRVLSVEPEFGVCEWRISRSNRFMVEGLGVPSYVGIEYMAQCIAVHAGARARVRGDPPPLGFLLGTRQYEARIPYFVEGVTYQASCQQLIRSADGMGSFECKIKQGGRILAEARLAVLEQTDGMMLDV